MGKKKVIWILEDDEGSRFVYSEILSLRYELEFFETLGKFRKKLERIQVPPALVIADIRLPDGDFVNQKDLLSRHDIPFIVVSSVDDLDILRKCYEEGALDYITKPFGRSELIVKIERLLLEDDGRAEMDLDIDVGRMRISRSGSDAIQLTAKEFQILSILKNAENHTSGREEIIMGVWGDVKVGLKTLDVHIFNLRRKLQEIGGTIRFTPPKSYTLILFNS